VRTLKPVELHLPLPCYLPSYLKVTLAASIHRKIQCSALLCSALLADIEIQSLLIYLFTVLLYMKPCMHYSIKSSSRRSSIESDRVSSSPPTGNDDNRGTSTAADVVG
jgi:hypothetical protein